MHGVTSHCVIVLQCVHIGYPFGMLKAHYLHSDCMVCSVLGAARRNQCRAHLCITSRGNTRVLKCWLTYGNAVCLNYALCNRTVWQRLYYIASVSCVEPLRHTGAQPQFL